MRSRRVREARALQRRAIREKRGLFLAEGPQAIREAIARPDLLVEVFATPEAASRHADLLNAASVQVHLADVYALGSLSETVTPQGLIAACRLLTVPLGEALASQPRLVAVLVEVRDPGNAGTIIRCADAAGADSVILAGDSVDPHSGKCVRATAGSLFHLPIVSGAGVVEVVDSLRQRGMAILAADGAGRTDLDDAADTGLLAGPTAWLFGNEAHGLPTAAVQSADRAVRVPMYGRAESLNLATAAAVCLYASARAHRRS
ncbi:MAG TPA: RNA methyltransferase [Jiangellaceae bacterium]|nr:RNA methyltransferase [Jiangellaceae bacterium]